MDLADTYLHMCAALAPGTPLPAIPSNFEFAQLAPGVLAIISQMDQQYLIAPPVTEASPATPQGDLYILRPATDVQREWTGCICANEKMAR